jgi:VWFA-related protein
MMVSSGKVVMGCFGVAAVGLLGAALTLAQQGTQPAPGTPDAGDVVFRTQVDRVVLHAAVVDSKQRLITGLPQSAFRLYQDGKLVPLRGFSNRDIPVSMGLVIDSSASMLDKRDSVNASALALVRASHPEDEVFVVNFRDTAALAQDYTSDITMLERSLVDVSMWGGTAVLDAVHLAVQHLQQATKGKKVLLVVSDGEDDSSDISQDELIAVLQKAEATVYAIGLLSREPSSKRKNAERMLRDISRVSGGASYFPKTTGEVEALATKIANDIRNQYVLEFAVPAGTKPGFRNLRVEATSNHSGKLSVRTRPGYVYQPGTAAISSR